MEVEWFKMSQLSWENITTILTQTCRFIGKVKSLRPVTCTDINTASKSSLEKLPLVGPRIANNILSARAKKPFSSIEDLYKVKKLGSGVINAFKEFILFSNETDMNEGTELININQASIDELKVLPKIGNVLAENIVRYREKNQFIEIDDLEKVHGIGPKIFAGLQDLVEC
jgi:competence ComEA-like helix-hairpin-helix protein